MAYEEKRTTEEEFGLEPIFKLIRQIVSKFGCLSPVSIIAKWLRAKPANPLKTSWESFLSVRSLRMTLPAAALLNSIIVDTPFS